MAQALNFPAQDTDKTQAYITWDPANAIYFDVVTAEIHESTMTITEHPVEQGSAISDHAVADNPHISLEVFVSNEPIYAPGDAANTGVTLDIKTYNPGLGDLINLDPRSASPLGVSPGGLYSAGLNAVSGAISGLLGTQPSNVANLFTFTTGKKYVELIYNALRGLQLNLTLVTVSTPYRVYNNMLLQRLSMPRNAENGTGAIMQLDFQSIRLVTVAVVQAPVTAESRGQGLTQKGVQEPKPDDTGFGSALFKAGVKSGTYNLAGSYAPPGVTP